MFHTSSAITKAGSTLDICSNLFNMEVANNSGDDSNKYNSHDGIKTHSMHQRKLHIKFKVKIQA